MHSQASVVSGERGISPLPSADDKSLLPSALSNLCISPHSQQRKETLSPVKPTRRVESNSFAQLVRAECGVVSQRSVGQLTPQVEHSPNI